jgi:TusA-related sulfurtransferase
MAVNDELLVDARGTRCPYPVIELARAAASRPVAHVILLADDPVALTDVPAWCRMRRAELLRVEECEDHWCFEILTRHPAGR